MIYSPLEQFTIFEILFFNNYSYYLFLVPVFMISIAFVKSTVSVNVISYIYQSVLDTVSNFLPNSKSMYLPVSFAIFVFVLVGNLIGLVPYSYSITCELAFTLALSLSILLGVTIIGFQTHGIHYFSYFLPSGTPLALVPLLVLIELVSYIAKGLSLGIRLAGNIISGHLLLHIISGFIFQMSLLVAILPLVILIALLGLEFIIAFLQAYVFCILFTVYLKDSIDLH